MKAATSVLRPRPLCCWRTIRYDQGPNSNKQTHTNTRKAQRPTKNAMWHLAVFLKPFVVVWAGLNLLDEVGWMIKLGRLVGASVTPALRRDDTPDAMCALCDDVLSDFLKGKDGLQAVPCSWACLRVPACMGMCRNMQEASETSTKFPCIAAGYCADHDDDGDGRDDTLSDFSLADVECARGPMFSCEPKKYCRRQRQRGTFWRFTCDLRPGMGRWVGMQDAAAKHAAALGSAFMRPKRCGEADAGPYCIAEPSGLGRLAEVLGVTLSLLYGGYQSVVAIETPGGDDDQQWLTFWLILVLTMLTERAVARVLLSKVPFYYELKLGLLVWLLFFDGATVVYRRFLRKQLSRWSSYFAKLLRHHNQESAEDQLRLLQEIGGVVISRKLRTFDARLKHNPSQRSSAILVSKVVATTMVGGSHRLIHGTTGGAHGSPLGESTMTTLHELQADHGDQSMPASGTSDNDNINAFSWEYDYTEQNGSRVGGTRNRTDATEMLYLISKWILSAEGLQTMEREFQSKQLPVAHNVPDKEVQIDNDDAVALLMERAAAVLAFQPRYVNIRVIGTKEGPEGQLPAMDGNGKADCYIKCRLVSCENVVVDTSEPDVAATAAPASSTMTTTTPPSQALSNTTAAVTSTPPVMPKATSRPYPEQGVVTRIAYRTLQPVWNEDLEISIRGGNVDSSGTYRNRQARHTVLQVEAWDADVGRWGVARDVFRVSALVLVGALFAAYVTGALDYLLFGKHISRRALRRVTSARIAEALLDPNVLRWGRWALFGTAAFVVAGWVVTYFKYVVWRSDDEFIGRCEVPLEILLDQREHALCLKLHDPFGENRRFRRRVAATRDSSGEVHDANHAESESNLGILRVILSMSE